MTIYEYLQSLLMLFSSYNARILIFLKIFGLEIDSNIFCLCVKILKLFYNLIIFYFLQIESISNLYI